jgi:hypothetical protein
MFVIPTDPELVEGERRNLLKINNRKAPALLLGV